jgi:hypothetical protein
VNIRTEQVTSIFYRIIHILLCIKDDIVPHTIPFRDSYNMMKDMECQANISSSTGDISGRSQKRIDGVWMSEKAFE